MQISTATVEIVFEISQIKEKIILLFHSWAHTQNSTRLLLIYSLEQGIEISLVVYQQMNG